MRTVLTTDRKLELWDGKVLIDEIREFHDSRGYLAEVLRMDDEDMYPESDDIPKMCYVSGTKPYVMRGPHQHDDQTDWFYTYHARMSYHLFNPETNEMQVFITDPDKITRVKVAPPIVHSYRNLENRQVFTSNYPTSLFMGWEKKEKVDEIRWEGKVAKNQTFVVLGAGGRLGGAITNELFKTMEMHRHHVVPIYGKFKDTDDVYEMFTSLDTAFTDFETGKIDTERVTIINCAAFANVQKAQSDDIDLDKEVSWANTDMPLFLAKQTASRGWGLIQFSTDYIYQRLKSKASLYSELGHYTRSKIAMESKFELSPAELTANVKMIRVANLYAIDDGERKHNIFKKFNKVKSHKKNFVIDPNVTVFPTEVHELAEFIVKNLALDADTQFSDALYSDKYEKINLIPSNSYSLDEFIKRFFGAEEFNIYNNDVSPWADGFTGNINNGGEDGCLYVEFEADEFLIYDAIERLQED